MSQNAYDCPSSCEDQLPPVSINDCAPNLLDAGILYVLVGRPGESFANVEDPSEHSDRTSNTSTADNALRRLKGVGSYQIEFGEGEKIGRDTFFKKNTGTVNFKIYDNNAVNYELIRSLGCNTKFQVWLIDSNGLIYGGNDGIPVVLQGRENINESVDERKFLELNGVHEFKNSVPRNDYPLAGDIDLDGNV